MVQSRNVPAGSPREAVPRSAAISSVASTELFQALGEPTRLRIVACLACCGREASVGEIAECCAVDLSVVSRHLALLERAGVLAARKHGRSVLYRVRYGELSGALRTLADAIDAFKPADEAACTEGGCCPPPPDNQPT